MLEKVGLPCWLSVEPTWFWIPARNESGSSMRVDDCPERTGPVLQSPKSLTFRWWGLCVCGLGDILASMCVVWLQMSVLWEVTYSWDLSTYTQYTFPSSKENLNSTAHNTWFYSLSTTTSEVSFLFSFLTRTWCRHEWHKLLTSNGGAKMWTQGWVPKLMLFATGFLILRFGEGGVLL